MYLLLIAIILILTLRHENKITRQMRTNEEKKNSQQQNTEWKSEWTWNEETQLWEHPLSKKAELPPKAPNFSGPTFYHQPPKPVEPIRKSEYQNAYEAT